MTRVIIEVAEMRDSFESKLENDDRILVPVRFQKRIETGSKLKRASGNVNMGWMIMEESDDLKVGAEWCSGKEVEQWLRKPQILVDEYGIPQLVVDGDGEPILDKDGNTMPMVIYQFMHESELQEDAASKERAKLIGEAEELLNTNPVATEEEPKAKPRRRGR